MSQLDELRSIIVGRNADELAELKERIEDVEQRTRDVAQVLSPAIEKEVANNSEHLAVSLQKPVSIGLKRAIRSEPEEYAEILYPVMAPSIRRAIAQSISSMMVTINRTIESATTVQGLSLRYESLRTGVAYAELALRKTLLYRVENLYLIHTETGMAIASLHTDNMDSLDSDAVSAMFSAIQSFVQDSFSRDESSRLTDLKVGEHNVWVAHGPRTMLACVIRGDAPESLKAELYDTLDYIRTRYANALVDFDGDTRTFDGVDGLLQPLLQSEIKEKGQELGGSKGAKKSLPFASMLALLIGAGLAIYFAAQWLDGKSKISTVEHFLRATPGIAATDIYWDGGRMVIEGLKDPDAIIPYNTFSTYNIDQNELRFNMIPFRSLEVAMELQRFRNELTLPEGVVLEAFNENEHMGSQNGIESSVVQLKGKAPLRWLMSNEARIEQLAADRRLSIRQLSPSLDSLKAELLATLPQIDLSELEFIESSHDQHMIIHIGGQIDQAQFSAIKSLLAGNHWVTLTATPK